MGRFPRPGGRGGPEPDPRRRDPVLVLTEHVTRRGRPKLVKACGLPLTGAKVVDRIITDLADFDVAGDHLVLRRLAPGVGLEDIAASTEAAYVVALDE